MVSIHAPARGATSSRIEFRIGLKFQSTRPQGARRRRGKQIYRSQSFNPRARKGRDQIFRYALFGHTFQSTRPQGARLYLPTSVLLSKNVSIHAPARGATRLRLLTRPEIRFQSTRPQGARLGSAAKYQAVSVSIHAPARGATRTVTGGPSLTLFQSTRPQGARPQVLA